MIVKDAWWCPGELAGPHRAMPRCMYAIVCLDGPRPPSSWGTQWSWLHLQFRKLISLGQSHMGLSITGGVPCHNIQKWWSLGFPQPFGGMPMDMLSKPLALRALDEQSILDPQRARLKITSVVCWSAIERMNDINHYWSFPVTNLRSNTGTTCQRFLATHEFSSSFAGPHWRLKWSIHSGLSSKIAVTING